VKDPWFTGYPTAPRWMELRRSDIGLRSVKAGITLNPPSLDEHRAVLEQLCVNRDDTVGDDDGFRISVAQRELLDGTIVDVEDRVVRGAVVLSLSSNGGPGRGHHHRLRKRSRMSAGMVVDNDNACGQSHDRRS